MPNFLEPVSVQVGPDLCGYGERTYVRPLCMQLCVLVLLVFSLLHGYALRPATGLVRSPARPLTLVSHHTTASLAAAAGAVPVSTPPPVAVPAAASIPACQATDYILPSALALAPASEGVTVQVDTPTYYQIYGNDSATVRAQLKACAPKMTGVEAAGNTSYTIDWQYDYTAVAGTCTVSDAKIGVHVGTALPEWRSNAETSATFASKMHTFETNLATHEHGHADLDIAMANTMFTQLSALAPTSCEGLAQAVNAQMQEDLQVLNDQNNSYDAVTNHGAVQGVVIP